MKSFVKIIGNIKDLQRVISYCKQTGYACVDFETEGVGREFYVPDSHPIMLSISFQPGSSWILPLNVRSKDVNKPWDKHVKMLFQLFCEQVIEDMEIVKVGWNLKFEYKWFKKYGYIMKGRLFDGMLAKYLLDEERPNDLKSMVDKLLPEWAGYGLNTERSEWYKFYTYDEICKYAARDTDATLRLMLYFESRLMDLGFYNLFRSMFCPAIINLGNSEFEGIPVNKKYLESLIIIYKHKIERNEKSLRILPVVKKFEKAYAKSRIQTLIDKTKEELLMLEDSAAIARKNAKISNLIAGAFTNNKERKLVEPLNFGSPAQLCDFFFNHPGGLQLKPVAYTESGAPSTDEDSLKKLKNKDKHGFIDKLLSYRELAKLYSTYIIGVYDQLDNWKPNESRIHTSFLIHGTVTGRYSSRDPNLQNIPRTTTNRHVKKMFIPPPGYYIFELDYSQAELRIVAELANDKAMIDVFERGYNIHMATGLRMIGQLDKYDEANKARKDANHPDHIKWIKIHKRGKVTNFSIIYEQGDMMTAEQLDVSIDEARQFKKDFFKAYPGVKRWREKQHEFAIKHGYVLNFFGQKRRLHNIDSPNQGKRAESLRQSVNAPIQGGSAEFTNFSGITIEQKRLHGELPMLKFPQLYTVHDSLGYSILPKDVHDFAKITIPICANPETEKYFGVKMAKVKMKASVSLGITWGELLDYDSRVDYVELYNKLKNGKS